MNLSIWKDISILEEDGQTVFVVIVQSKEDIGTAIMEIIGHDPIQLEVEKKSSGAYDFHIYHMNSGVVMTLQTHLTLENYSKISLLEENSTVMITAGIIDEAGRVFRYKASRYVKVKLQ